jgi:sigma-E factor negative regulatory protein RseC
VALEFICEGRVLMQTDEGIVVARDGEFVTVELQPREGCVSCSLAQFCSGNKGSVASLRATAGTGIGRGDVVEVALDDSVVLKASLVMYGLPLAAFLAGVLAGYGLSFLLQPGTAVSILLPVIGGFLLLIPGILVSRRMALHMNPTARVLHKVAVSERGQP